MAKLQTLIFIDDSKLGIDDNTLEDVEKQLNGKSGDQLFLILQSYGGSPFAAVRIVRNIQKRFKKIICIVPDYAMSAGTLMALGTDEIYMQQRSMLGPLDLPIEHPVDGSIISALDVQNTITTISTLSDSIASQRYKNLRDESKLGKKAAAEIAYKTATKFVQPIVKQIDPYHLQKSFRELKIGFNYAYELLKSRMMLNNIYQAWMTAKSLVNNYPAHEYGIFSDEAKKTLKLNILDMDSLKEWSSLKPEFDLNKDKSYAIIFKEVDYDVSIPKRTKQPAKRK